MSFSPAAPDRLPPLASSLSDLVSYAADQERTAKQARWFREQVLPHEADLRSYLHRKFPMVTDVDDLVQEAYARMFRARDCGAVFEPRPFLFTIARNVAYDLFRRNRNVSLDELEERAGFPVVEDKADAAEITSHAQELDLLAEAIQALPRRCREVLTMRRLHGLSYHEIALRMGISENTVNAQLAIGMVRCRQYLEARGVLKGGPDVT